jgi:hypothetical protein
MSYELYNPCHGIDVAEDWRLYKKRTWPIKIACVQSLCTRPGQHSYHPDFEHLDWRQFDLVLISDIEMNTISTIESWIAEVGIGRCLIAVGGVHDHETLDPARHIYRPWWVYNLLRCNTEAPPDLPQSRIWGFDALLGARRPHRDFVMQYMTQHGMLDRNIVTYREFFGGAVVDEVSERVAQHFGQPLTHPYVSPHLEQAWEVPGPFNNSISSRIPHTIYSLTKWSIVSETLGTGGCFFMSEKMAKVMATNRIFVHVGTRNYLAQLKELGFQTFGHIIDESYDSIPDDIERWTAAMEQVQWLQDRDYGKYQLLARPQLENNQRTLTDLFLRTQRLMLDRVFDAVESVQAANQQ